MVPVEDLGCAWSLRPHKLFLVAVADEDDLQAFTELYKLTVGNLRQLPRAGGRWARRKAAGDR